MTTLAEIEAATSELTQDQQRILLQWLMARMQSGATQPPEPHSVLDIPPVSLGRIIRLPGEDDDILGEMMEGRG
jgi:hypothetical protein